MNLQGAWKAEGPYIEKSVSIAASSLVRRLKLPPDELEDIKQSLRIDLSQRLPMYDREQSGLRTFITRLVRNKIENLWEYYTAKKRDYRETYLSLDQEIETDDGAADRQVERWSTDDYDRAVLGRTSTAQARLELSIDVRRVMSHLDDDQIHICQLIISEPTLVDVARSLVYRAQPYTSGWRRSEADSEF